MTPPRETRLDAAVRERGLTPPRESAGRPAEVCGRLLAALAASDGRRKSRKRDQTADAIGLGIKRTLLTAVVADDPAPEAFEGWLLERCLAADGGDGVGPVRALALEILGEWRLAQASAPFQTWLAEGAPSDDRAGTSPPERA